MAVAADNDKLCSGVGFLGKAHQLQPVVTGHPDVGDGDIRGQLPDFFQGFDSIFRGGDHPHVKSLPVHQGLDQLANLVLVVCNQYIQHEIISSGAFAERKLRGESGAFPSCFKKSL